MPPRVVITRRLPVTVEARAAQDYDIEINEEDRPLTAEHILEACEGADALLPCVADPLPAELIDALPASVRIISNFGVGLDHLDMTACRKRDITVTNTPGVLTEATADVAMLLILGAARRAREGVVEITDDLWPGWSPTHLLGTGLQGKRLGIVGLGRIGQAVARRARAFGMELHYHSRQKRLAIDEHGATFHASLDGLLTRSDILILTCASTPETRNMINARALALLPKGAILINPARGDLIVDDHVIEALQDGTLSAAGLDVFAGEPRMDPRYRTLKNVFALPHIGSATIETRTAMGMLALDNLDAFFAGETPPHIVQA